MTETRFSIGQLLSAAGRRMADELRERLVPHRGEQGAARETVIRDFLRAQLPLRFELSSGFVFDAQGNVSDQLDIIIADTMIAPRFEAAGGVRFYPCESVVAVGQVRTNADSKRKTWDAFCNLRSVAQLDRSADGRATCDGTSEPIDYKGNHLHRIFTFLFVIDGALDGETMREVVFDYATRSEPHLWPNLVFTLDRYIVTFHCEDGVCPNTAHARGVSLVRAE